MIYFLIIVLSYFSVIFSQRKIRPTWNNLYPNIPPSAPPIGTNDFNIISKLDDKELIDLQNDNGAGYDLRQIQYNTTMITNPNEYYTFLLEEEIINSKIELIRILKYKYIHETIKLLESGYISVADKIKIIHENPLLGKLISDIYSQNIFSGGLLDDWLDL